MSQKKEPSQRQGRRSPDPLSPSKTPESKGHASWRAIELWLAGHQRHVLAVLVALSVLLCLLYFIEIDNSPCLWQHRWDQTDMNFADRPVAPTRF